MEEEMVLAIEDLCRVLKEIRDELKEIRRAVNNVADAARCQR